MFRTFLPNPLGGLSAKYVAFGDVPIAVGVSRAVKICTLEEAHARPSDGRTHTLLGSPEYLAPEIFLAKGHGTPVDMWALGSTLSTMCLAAHPYGGDTPELLYAEVLRGPPFFPKASGWPPIFPAAARALTELLLQHEPLARPTANSIWQHPFFAESVYGTGAADDGPLMREALCARTVAPPFVPFLASPFDTRYHSTPASDDSEDGAEDEKKYVGSRLQIQQQYCDAESVAMESIAVPVAEDEDFPQGDVRSMRERCGSLDELLQMLK